MNFAREVADRAIFMDEGRIVEQGAAQDLFLHPQHQRTRQFLAKFQSGFDSASDISGKI